ncbi:NAD(P)H-hydrate dehydratase [Mitsuaria sp. GD03876]|uniref:NAD(P)H-hydrate dehydratase n=1 Tax=Mitsuaria sp. GD03876 TaxID=2975399 RepID=UPI00244B4A4A|nr:NAD(P)H-hydrate dehydratase [Mitsuaria sp. GD03876]MDH0868314.1 NAD(P)H-hydrate dehydratase [Mitsuaria sp. GD03876]
MLAVLPLAHDWPLHDAASSRRVETAALSRHPPHTLIERAGLAVARLALALKPCGQSAIVVAGPGNNGGDGLVAARHLAALGWQVHVALVGSTPKAGSDAAHALSAAQQAGIAPRVGLDALPRSADLVIDALLGLGASRAPEGDFATAIQAIDHLRRAGAVVLAVDVPSGLDVRTGQPLGVDVVRADHTLSFLTLKAGLFTGEGRALAGRLWFDDLGESVDEDGLGLLVGQDRIAQWQRAHARSAASHKGRQGDVVVLGGAPSMRGAAWLAASSALAAGAGRVYAALPDDDGQPWPARPELMHWDFARWNAPTADWRDVVAVCGCGGGAAIAPALSTVLHGATRVVLDADALNLIAADESLRHAVTQRAAHGWGTVLTPHPLEAARLLGLRSAAEVQADRLQAATELARRYGATVVLKGSGSVVVTRNRPLSINSTGSSALATAGSGDVLAGWIGGLWAQSPGVPPHDLACAAVAWHGAAAQDHAGPMLAADLIDAMAALHAPAA